MFKALLIILFAAAATMACKTTHKIELKDSEGRRFQATCKQNDCQLSTSEVPNPTGDCPAGAKPGFALHRGSRLYGICEAWNVDKPELIDCRPLVCEKDTDCPPALGLEHGSCTNKLCIEPSGQVSADDAEMLCLAGTGRAPATPQHRERFGLASLCGNPCVVPKVCRQP